MSRGQAGPRTNFDTLAARAKQQWPFVEPCMCEPPMVTPLKSNSQPHFKPPLAQGWPLQCYENEVLTSARVRPSELGTDCNATAWTRRERQR